MTSEFAFLGWTAANGSWTIVCSEDRRRRWSRHRHRGGTPPPRLAHQLLRPIWMRRTASCCSRPSSWRRRTGSSGRSAAAAGRGDEGARAMDRHRRRGAQPMDRHRCFPMRGCSFAVQRDACCVHSWHRIHKCVAALAVAELSTTEACAARAIRLLCRGLFSCVAMVHVCDADAWVQLCCSAGRMLRAQLPPDSQVCGGAGNCRVKHNRGLCRTRDPFAVPRLVFVRGYGACTQFRCVGAALLLSGARAACTAGTGFTDVAALAIAELSTTEAFCRTRDPFAVPWLVFVRGYGASA